MICLTRMKFWRYWCNYPPQDILPPKRTTKWPITKYIQLFTSNNTYGLAFLFACLIPPPCSKIKCQKENEKNSPFSFQKPLDQFFFLFADNVTSTFTLYISSFVYSVIDYGFWNKPLLQTFTSFTIDYQFTKILVSSK